MREIKFRAWDGKQMLGMPLDGLYGLGRFFGFLSANKERGNVHKYEVMQYTGLKDKNGKEIYEGDLVTDDSIVSEEGLHYLGQVIWGKVGFELLHNCTCEEYHGVDDCNLRVIGNIYENPMKKKLWVSRERAGYTIFTLRPTFDEHWKTFYTSKGAIYDDCSDVSYGRFKKSLGGCDVKLKLNECKRIELTINAEVKEI
jgi:hypothetical protein